MKHNKIDLLSFLRRRRVNVSTWLADRKIYTYDALQKFCDANDMTPPQKGAVVFPKRTPVSSKTPVSPVLESKQEESPGVASETQEKVAGSKKPKRKKLGDDT